jgi:dynamin 1-like protein
MERRKLMNLKIKEEVRKQKKLQMKKSFDAGAVDKLNVIKFFDSFYISEEEVRKTLAGEILPFKKGIVGVVNRNKKDINNNRSIQESIAKEQQFFQRNYPELEETHGTLFLLSKLQRILIEHIQDCLPTLRFVLNVFLFFKSITHKYMYLLIHVSLNNK